MTTGLLHHLSLTLRLNFRSKQALIYGYVVPIFFLLAFGVYYRNDVPPLLRHMGQLLTITVLGGACFGMPTTMVAERERGVWRRYRLLPTASGGLILSAVIGRFLIVLTGALLQILLARWVFDTPFPAHPLDLLVIFLFTCFAFMGLGLIIAMLATDVPAVQALGQAIFLPMIILGGVGIPLTQFSGRAAWVRQLASFLPGRYAVEAIDACYAASGGGLAVSHFAIGALFFIGMAAYFAGANLFRWDAGQRVANSAKAWVAVALAAWALVGVAAKKTNRLVSSVDRPTDTRQASSKDRLKTEPATTSNSASPTSGRIESVGALRTMLAVVEADRDRLAEELYKLKHMPPPVVVKPEDKWKLVTDAQLQAVTYDDLPSDQDTVTPLARNLDNLDDDSKKRMDTFEDNFSDWKLFKDEQNVCQKVRYALSAASVADNAQDQHEGEIAYIVFDQIRRNVPEDELKKAVGYIILHQEEGLVATTIKELGIEGDVVEDAVRERCTMYGKKLLFRLLGKDKDLAK